MTSRLDQMTDTGREWLSDEPPWYQNDPQVQAVIDVQSREYDRITARRDMFVDAAFIDRADPSYFPIYELIAGLSVNPAGLTTNQRRTRIQAWLSGRQDRSSGTSWEAIVDEMIGQHSWSYAEQTPGDGQLTVTIPFGSGLPQAQDIRNLLRARVPAHIQIIVDYDQGFIVGVSQVGEEVL